MDSYKCTGVQKFNGSDGTVQVFAPNQCCSCGNEEKIHNDSPVNEFFQRLQTGSVIVDVYDCENRTERVICLQSEDIVETFSFEKRCNGPLTRHLLMTDVIYLSDDSKVIFIKESEEYSHDTSSVIYDIIYADLKTRSVNQYSFSLPDLQSLGSLHILSLHSSQLIVCYSTPIKVIVVDFNRPIVRMQTWSSDSNASRFLTCLNIVVVLDNHKNPNQFLCLTFCDGMVHEVTVPKPKLFLGKDKFELPQVVNVNGKVIWIAQNESRLILLSLLQSELIILKQFHLGCISKQNEYRAPIRNMLCWNNSKLLVPLLCMAKVDVNQTNANLTNANSYEIVMIDLLSLNVSCILRAENEMNIYTDHINLAISNNGDIVIVNGMKKTSGCVHIGAVFQHMFYIKPSCLKEMTINAVLTNSSFDFIKNCSLLRYKLLKCYNC